MAEAAEWAGQLPMLLIQLQPALTCAVCCHHSNEALLAATVQLHAYPGLCLEANASAACDGDLFCESMVAGLLWSPVVAAVVLHTICDGCTGTDIT